MNKQINLPNEGYFLLFFNKKNPFKLTKVDKGYNYLDN